jgi:GTP cyclohydrolase IA
MTFEELETGACLAGLDSAEDFSQRSDAPSRDVEGAVRLLIKAAGDDPDREGLVETPAGVARAYREWFAGYAIDPRTLLSKVFTDADDYDETVLLRNIPLVSTCEHHLAPITGHAHVAYRPNGRVVGISKLARVVDAYARRMQLQERLTRQIARTLDEVLQPLGVAVVIEASHGCMSSRGVNHQGVSMVTKCWLGDFKTMPELRRELMESISGCRDRS